MLTEIIRYLRYVNILDEDMVDDMDDVGEVITEVIIVILGEAVLILGEED